MLGCDCKIELLNFIQLENHEFEIAVLGQLEIPLRRASLEGDWLPRNLGIDSAAPANLVQLHIVNFNFATSTTARTTCQSLSLKQQSTLLQPPQSWPLPRTSRPFSTLPLRILRCSSQLNLIWDPRTCRFTWNHTSGRHVPMVSMSSTCQRPGKTKTQGIMQHYQC